MDVYYALIVLTNQVYLSTLRAFLPTQSLNAIDFYFLT
jgi:hypothetical protein